MVNAVNREDIKLCAHVKQVNIILKGLGVGPEDSIWMQPKLRGNTGQRVAVLHSVFAHMLAHLAGE